MTIEAALYAELTGDGTISGLVSTRVYPLYAPQDASLPYIVYQFISRITDYSQSGATGMKIPRVQIRSVAATYDGAQTLAAAVESVLSGFSGTMGSGDNTAAVDASFLDNELDDYEARLIPFEADLSAHEIIQDYIFWHR